MPLNRREFTKQSAVAGAGLALTGVVGALATAPEALAADDPETYGAYHGHDHDHDHGHGHGHGHRLGYGPLVADPEGMLALPAGFSYRVVTHSGVTRLESGEFTPSNHDGTAAFAGPRGTTYLVNNHELKGTRDKWDHPVPLTEGLVYDPAAAAWLHGRRGAPRRHRRRVGRHRRHLHQLRGRQHRLGHLADGRGELGPPSASTA